MQITEQHLQDGLKMLTLVIFTVTIFFWIAEEIDNYYKKKRYDNTE